MCTEDCLGWGFIIASLRELIMISVIPHLSVWGQSVLKKSTILLTGWKILWKRTIYTFTVEGWDFSLSLKILYTDGWKMHVLILPPVPLVEFTKDTITNKQSKSLPLRLIFICFFQWPTNVSFHLFKHITCLQEACWQTLLHLEQQDIIEYFLNFSSLKNFQKWPTEVNFCVLLNFKRVCFKCGRTLKILRARNGCGESNILTSQKRKSN